MAGRSTNSVNAIRQLSPVLTVFAAPASFILRLEDVAYNSLVLAVAREIKSGSLVVITPTATKVFDLGPPAVPRPEPGSTLSQTPAPSPSLSDIPADLHKYVEDEAEVEDNLPPIVEPEFQESRVRHREHTAPADNSVCGRCNGTGQTMAGGGCPVCGGRGTIISWGRRAGRSR